MGMGLIGTVLAGAASGAGAGIAKGAELYGDYLARSTLEQERAEIQKLRDERMAEIAKEGQERGFAHAEKQMDKQIDATKAEGEAGRGVTREGFGLQRDLATQTDTRIKEEGAATRKTQTDIADTHERAATQRHRESIGQSDRQMRQAAELAEANRPLQVNEKGEFFYKDNKGGVQFVYDPVAPEGGRVKSQKDLTTAEKVRMEAVANAVLANIKAVQTDMNLDDKSKRAQIADLMKALHGNSGPKTEKETMTPALETAIKRALAKNDTDAIAEAERRVGAEAVNALRPQRPTATQPAKQTEGQMSAEERMRDLDARLKMPGVDADVRLRMQMELDDLAAKRNKERGFGSSGALIGSQFMPGR